MLLLCQVRSSSQVCVYLPYVVKKKKIPFIGCHVDPKQSVSRSELAVSVNGRTLTRKEKKARIGSFGSHNSVQSAPACGLGTHSWHTTTVVLTAWAPRVQAHHKHQLVRALFNCSPPHWHPPERATVLYSPPMVFCWRRRGRFDGYYGDNHYAHRRWRKHHHAIVTGFCLITASILFLFVALSLPIIKSIYLLQLEGHPSSSQPATSIGTELRFGVWGFCVTRSARITFFFFFLSGFLSTELTDIVPITITITGSLTNVPHHHVHQNSITPSGLIRIIHIL